jgi:hypothetical protein
VNKAVPNLSASSAKTLQSCSWQFYAQYIRRLPERVWAKTKIGSLTHTILECLQNPRHRKHYETLIRTEDINTVPSIARLRDNFYLKNPDVTEKIAADLDSLVITALNHDFFNEGAEKVLPPEMKFQLKVGKAAMKGFMDNVSFYKDHVKIRDFKTQSKKFTQEELDDNIQAAIYQLAIKQMFNLPARVEFVLLRFPPNKKDPNRHVQIVEPYSETKLNGLVQYLEYLHEEFNTFDEQKAKANLKVFEDKGFCQRVCGYKDPFKYWALVQPDGKFTTTKVAPETVPANVKVEEHVYTGCPYFYNADGRARNWQ